MRTSDRGSRGSTRDRRGFTLIELLVVVAIIALLVSILLPSLSKAKAMAQAVRCATNMKSLGNAVAIYTTEWDVYPPSYVYPKGNGTWDPMNQDSSHPNGYLHWSYLLLGQNMLADTAFICPANQQQGVPRTNPGPDAADWESAQVDQNGSSSPNSLHDLQARRTSYTANAAIMPRNKFTRALSGGSRVNRLVQASELSDMAGTIMVAEFRDTWQAAAVSDGGVLSKSHRPVNPFWHISSGADEYNAPDHGHGASGFTYGPGDDFGLQEESVVAGKVGLINGSAGPEINAVGRHHPGEEDRFGGAANFLYCDGHVERKTIHRTMVDRDWGDRYYSLSGGNVIMNY